MGAPIGAGGAKPGGTKPGGSIRTGKHGNIVREGKKKMGIAWSYFELAGRVGRAGRAGGRRAEHS